MNVSDVLYNVSAFFIPIAFVLGYFLGRADGRSRR